jgi:energy-coupling factor transporter ATP-binding protein EcfA2
MALRLGQLTTTDGYLSGVSIEFAPGLNCIIGARGTCKSTIVETIRFLFDDDRTRVKELLDDRESGSGPPHRGLIAATLGGGTAQVRLIDDPDGREAAVIERDAGSDRPAIYRDGVVVVEDQRLLSEIEIYSQGELQDIATDAAKRLALIDRPSQSFIDRWNTEIHQVSAEVAEIGPQIRQITEAIEAADASLAEGAPLLEQLDRLRAERPQMSSEVSSLRQAHQEREARLERGTAALTRFGQAAESLHSLREGMAAAAAEAATLRNSGNADLEMIAARLDDAAAEVEKADGSMPDTGDLEALLQKARDIATLESEPYYEALREQEAITDQLKQEDRLTEEAKKLGRIQETKEANATERDSLRSKRETLRAKLRELRSRIFDTRLSEVERINDKFSDRIVLALRQGTQSDRYRSRLENLLDGSRLRDRPRLCAELAAAFPPDVIVGLVEAEDSTTLSSTLDRDAGQMIRLVAHLGGSDDVFDLESHVPDDELEVTMYVSGVPHSVSELSKGQKATAMLPLLLRSAPYPLILDQPEDDLDNRFIFQTLVKAIEDLKEERQLIFVTHNANIPVIGNAERVMVMGMKSPEQAELAGAGDVEQMREPIIDLLEGGREAFELRRQTYDTVDG